MKTGILKLVKEGIYHHYFFSVFPILSLYHDNIEQLTLRSIIRPLLISLALALLIYLLIRYISKNKDKGALLTSTLLFFVFYYSPIFVFAYKLIDIDHLPFFLIWISAFIAITTLLGFTKKDLKKVNKLMNLFSLLSVAILVFFIIKFEFGLKKIDITHYPEDLQVLSAPAKLKAQQKPPDIYYIILDGYGREDVLNDLYKLDVGNFREFLKKKGFYIAADSHTNYSQTLLSLASSLNLRYLDTLIKEMGPLSKNRRPLIRMIEKNDLVTFLKRMGYSIITFDSGYPGTVLRQGARVEKLSSTLGEFENILINNTLLRAIFRKTNFTSHIKRIRFTLDKLGKLEQTTTPKFVFAHIICPHPPFVFKANGQTVIPDTDFVYKDGNHFVQSRETLLNYILGYRNQVTFINNQLKTLIQNLLDNPDNQPVIILQGDHGPGSRLNQESFRLTNLQERLAIFNAYYLPSGNYNDMYAKITPVNTFRVIINHYFGTSLKLLEDKAFYIRWSRPFHPIKINTSSHRTPIPSRLPESKRTTKN